MRLDCDGDPEVNAGEPVEDPWELVDGEGEHYGWPTLRKKVDDGSKLVPGPVPGLPPD